MLFIGAAACFAPHAAKMLHSIPYSTQASELPSPQPTPIVPTATTRLCFLPQAFDHLIDEAAARYKVNASLIKAVIRAESAFDPYAVSRYGAQGLMQLMPALAAQLGVLDPLDPRQNIMGGVRYLAQLLHAHNGDVELALASYNAGPGAVDFYNGVPPFPETQQYVKTITASLQLP